MQNAKSIRRRLDLIVSEPDPHVAMKKLVEVIFDIGMDACREREQLQKQIELIRIAVLGDGEPEKSIISRMEKFDACSRKIQEDVLSLNTFLIGDLSKGGETYGLKDKLQIVESNLSKVEKEVEKISSHLSKLNWIIIGAVVAQVLAAIFLR